MKKSDLKHVLKKNGWNFNWKNEFNDWTKEVYKLTIVNNPYIIQGLLSITIACKVSFQKGYDGFVAFTAKSQLIKHYEETLGTYHFKNQRMIIDTNSARYLITKCFKTL